MRGFYSTSDYYGMSSFDSLREYYQHAPLPKPEPRKRTKRRKDRIKGERNAEIRAYVFGRERDICRCCRKRAAQSMHEIVSRGRRGKVSKQNSIAVCGQLVGAEECCHTYLQQNQIAVRGSIYGAEDTLTFFPCSDTAAEWMRIVFGTALVSPVMRDTEIEC